MTDLFQFLLQYFIYISTIIVYSVMQREKLSGHDETLFLKNVFSYHYCHNDDFKSESSRRHDKCGVC